MKVAASILGAAAASYVVAVVLAVCAVGAMILAAVAACCAIEWLLEKVWRVLTKSCE